MKCDTKECEKEATVHLTEIVNNNITKLHLCEEHAKQKGVEMEQHFGIADLLQGLAEYGAPPVEAETKKAKCPNCGMTYDDFKKIGRLGCGDCYRTFRDSLASLLKRIHGSTQHTGKVVLAALSQSPAPAKTPGRGRSSAAKAQPPSQNVEALKEKLRAAVENESYEEAAKLRDQIRSLESPPARERKSE